MLVSSKQVKGRVTVMNYEQQYCEVKRDGITMRGMAYIANGAGPRPAVILNHGFGGSHTEQGCFVRLARTLANAGFHVFALDRTGQGDSDGEFFDVTVARDLADVNAIIDYVLAREEVDETNLHLVGLSMGAVLTTLVAAQRPNDVKSITCMSTAAAFVDEIKGGKLQGKDLSVIKEQGYLDFYGTRLGPAIVEETQNQEIYEAAQGYDGPVRMLHGTADFIPVSYAQKYREVYGSNLDLTIREGADHGWTSVPHRDFINEEIVKFVSAQAEKPARNAR